MGYDYKKGKERVESILANSMKIIDIPELPSGDNFTFENAYHSWVSAIFVDIRDSATLMSNADQEYVAKVIRCFTSEIIEILRGDCQERELGIRGDCVYAIFTTPSKPEIYSVFEKAIWINCYIDMLNALLKRHGYSQLAAGIGLALGHDHIIKAGRKGVGINNQVWMGDAVSKAAKLSGYGDKAGIRRIVMTSWFYDNIIESLSEENEEAPSWFLGNSGLPYGGTKHCNVIFSQMNDWISSGMPG